MRLRSVVLLLAYLLFTVGGGSTIGYLTAPGEWYASLNKPPFNPPGAVFGPVWAVLYVLVGVAGWRVSRAPLRSAQQVWWAQILLNFAWPLVFFGLEAPGAALLVILALLALILLFIALTARGDRLASLLFVPYAAWVLFATALNASILWLN